jgi:hypothetical protein
MSIIAVNNMSDIFIYYISAVFSDDGSDTTSKGPDSQF